MKCFLLSESDMYNVLAVQKFCGGGGEMERGTSQDKGKAQQFLKRLLSFCIVSSLGESLRACLLHHLALQVEMLHFLLAVSDANKGAGLCLLLRAALSLHLLLLLLPTAAHQVHTRRRAEEPQHDTQHHVMNLNKQLTATASPLRTQLTRESQSTVSAS